MKNFKKYFRLTTGLLLFLFASSCFAKKTNNNNPPHYDLQHPQITNLPHNLREISGLSFNSQTNTVFAISDGNGDLFEINPTNEKEVNKWKFHDKKDFEDVTCYGDRFYVLNSNGDLYEVYFKKNEKMKEKKYDFPFGKHNEFEIMYYDTFRKKLIIICKSCKSDDKDQLSTYSFDPVTHQYAQSPFTINFSALRSSINKLNKNFKPSAAAINPLTGELFIVSSINKTLVVADRNGVAKNVYPLEPGMYKQPEGITFLSNGDMIISNESHKQGDANLLYFHYKK